MAKPLTSFKNPITSTSGSVFDWTNWVGGILWVVMLGFILSIGVKAFTFIDNKTPGGGAPNMRLYQQGDQGPGLTIL